MDSLDYGRRFIVDCRRPPRGALPVEQARRYLEELHLMLEGSHVRAETVVVVDADGFSAAVVGADAHAVLHLFPDAGVASLFVFSRRDVLLSDVTRTLTEHFGGGRFESHVGNATKALPRDARALERVITGDRSYARVRLDDRLLAPL